MPKMRAGGLHTIFPKKVRESYQLLICGNMRLRIVFPQMAERSLWALIVEKIEPAKAIL